MFKKYDPKTKHSVTYGKNIIRVTMNDWLNVYDGVTVIGESPASESGPETSHWLKKEPMQSFAGNQEFPSLISKSSGKRRTDSQENSEENLNTIKSQLVVVMDLVGNPEDDAWGRCNGRRGTKQGCERRLPNQNDRTPFYQERGVYYYNQMQRKV